MKKISFWITSGVFLIFIGCFFLLNILIPDRDFSPQENRSLQQKPKFSVNSLLTGEFMTDYEKYCSDQFAGRDQWISMKAGLELMQGKMENNGIFLCEDQRLIQPYSAPSKAELEKKIQAVNTLVRNTDVPVKLGLIPGAADIYSDLLPEGVPNDSQRDVIDYIYQNVRADTIDIAGSLAEHRDEYIFYRTDHHWTSLGACYAYQALCHEFGIPVKSPENFSSRAVVSEDFYGTTYSSSGITWIRPDTMEIFINQPSDLQIQRYESPEAESIPLYAQDKLNVKDKYSFYLGGNTPRLVLNTQSSGTPSLLILRDSYCDSLTPFLLDDFSEIHILDLRYYRKPISDYIKENGIDEVLILYSVPNFSTDRNLILLTQ